MDLTVDQQRIWMVERRPQGRSRALIQYLGDCARSFPHSEYLDAGIKPGRHGATNMSLSERNSIIVEAQR